MLQLFSTRMVILSFTLMIAGCSAVGLKVPSDIDGLCKIYSSCLRENNDISISYLVTTSDDEFEVSGTASLIGYDGYHNATFQLFLIKDNVIVDVINIRAGDGSSETIKFYHKFKAEDFDATLITISIGSVLQG